MVNIVENWSRIEGTVVEWERPSSENAPGVLHVRIDTVGDVVRDDGTKYRNLLPASEGHVVSIQVPAAVAPTLEAVVGDRVTLEVRRGRAPTSVFARAESIHVQSSNK